MTPKDPIGPVLLSELHKTEFDCFPIRGNSDKEVAGMLYRQALAEHTEGGTVGQVMEQTVMYLREDEQLEAVLQAFSKTGRHEFMAINSEAALTGMITLKTVLEQIIGHSAKSEFEDYDDPGAVAAR